MYFHVYNFNFKMDLILKMTFIFEKMNKLVFFLTFFFRKFDQKKCINNFVFLRPLATTLRFIISTTFSTLELNELNGVTSTLWRQQQQTHSIRARKSQLLHIKFSADSFGSRKNNSFDKHFSSCAITFDWTFFQKSSNVPL